MRRSSLLLLVVVVTLLGSLATAAASSPPQNHRAALSGDQEVPAATTRARGQTTFQLDRTGTELRYRLIVANLQNVTMAHIHLAPAGQNGAVVAWLYPDQPPPQLLAGRNSGVLATGAITASDLVGPLAGRPLTDLMVAIETGQAYVNVHTQQYPGGEIRGQIR